MVSNLGKSLWSERRFLLMITLVALCVRSVWFIGYTRHEQNYEIAIDSNQYHEIAMQISQHKGITTKDNRPNFFRLPGYPVILAGLYKLLGTDPLPSLAVQLVLTAVIPCLIFLLSSVVLPGYFLTAKIAGVAAALHPGFILFAGMQASESLFLIFFLLFLILFFKGIEAGQWGYFAQAGFFLGIASLLRALGHYVIFLALLIIFFQINISWGKRLQSACFLFCSWLAIVGIWIARNYLLTGYIFLHTLTGQHFLRYNVVYNLMDSENITYSQAKSKIFGQRDMLIAQEELRMGRKLSEPEINNLSEKFAFYKMRRHPLLTLKHACIEIFKVCTAHYSCLVFQVPPGVIWASNTPLSSKISMYLITFKKYPLIIPFIIWDWLFELMLIVGMIQGIVLSCRYHDKFKRVKIMIPFMVLLLAITSSIGLIRLRLPVEPFFIIFAALGWTSLVQANRFRTLYPFIKHTND